MAEKSWPHRDIAPGYSASGAYATAKESEKAESS